MTESVNAFLPQTSARSMMQKAQGLGRPFKNLTQALEATGFIRTLGGIDAYLAARTRWPQLSRASFDEAVERGEFKVLPAARGCIYLVPRSQSSLALHLADLLTRTRALRDHEKSGIQEGELDTLGEAVIEQLRADGAQTTNTLRKALGDQVRSLGQKGKKVGVSSTLPPTLRQLEFAGSIERTLEGGRLDTERYLWRICEPNTENLLDPEEVHIEIGRLFFRAAGLATRKQFAKWSGLKQAEAKKAIAALCLAEVTVEGETEPRYQLEETSPPIEASQSAFFLPFGDNLIALQDGPRFFVDPAFYQLEVPVWGRGRGNTLGDASHSTLRSILWKGKIIGFWEYDPDQKAVVHGCFDPDGKEASRVLQERAEEWTLFIRGELEHGRSFSLDTDDNLRKRVAQIRTLTS